MKLKQLLTTLAAAVGLTTAAVGATPVAVWDGFKSLTSGDYTWTKAANATVDADGVLTLSSDGGLTIANPTGLNDGTQAAVTFIADIEGFNPSGTMMTVFDIGLSSGNRVNISNLSSSDTNLYQLWNAKNGFGNVGTISTGKVRIITTYRGASGTTTYIVGGNTANSTGLHSSNGSITSIGIGCYSTSQRVANGMKVYRLAMFNSKLSESDAKAYKFPSEEKTDCNATIAANADINWSEIVWDNEPTATSTVGLTLEGNAKITVADAAACGAITVKGTGTLTLDAGDNLTSEKITSEIPLVITTVKNQAVDAGENDLTYNYTGAAMASTVINVTSTGNLTFGGTSEFKYTATIPQGKTFTVADTCKVNYWGNDAQVIKGTVVIEAGATFANTRDYDVLQYGGSPTVNVYGTLDMGSTRWTIGSGNTINVYPGAQVIGAGNGTYKALDYIDNTATVVKFVLGEAASGTATMTAGIRDRSLAPTFDIPANMTVALGSAFTAENKGNHTFVKKGAGALKILDTLNVQTRNATDIQAGILDLTAMTDKATTNQIPGAMTVAEGVAIRFPEGFAEEETFALCGGTLTAEATVRKATVYIGDSATPVENATLLYDLENKTVAYTTTAPGSITITGDTNVQGIIDAVAAQEGEEYAGDVMVTMDADATLTVEKTFAYPKMTIVSTGAIAIDYQLEETDTYAKIDLVNVAGDLTLTTSVALPIAAGARNLTYNYNGEYAVTNTTISTTGVFTKGGTGTVTVNFGSSRTAATIVNAGTLAYAAQVALGNGAPITVNAGATLDFNGYPNGGSQTSITLNGGTLKNGVDKGGDTGQMQIKTLTLTADSTIDTPYQFGMVGSQYSATTINLDTYTLTKKGEGTFHVATATINGTGKIAVEAGTLDFFRDSTFANGTVELAGGTLNRAANLTAGAVAVTADSAITGSANLTAPVTISEDATLDCTAISLPIAGASLAAAQNGTLKVTKPACAAKIATATETVTGLTLVDENGDTLVSCTADGFFWYGEVGDTYTLTEDDTTAISTLSQGGVFTKQTTLVGLTTVAGTPEGCYAWVDGATVYAAKKSNSISIKFTPASANEGTIAAADENVGGYPVAGKFWNHSKVSTKTGVGGDGVTEIFALKDGNGEDLDGVLCYYFMQNMYDVNGRSVGGRNKQTTGNGKLTYSYFDDTDGLTPEAWPYSVGTYEERDYVLPATPVKEGVTANLRWEVAITNIPYQVFDLYLYQASDQTSETIKLLPLAVKANDGEWHYFAGDNAGSTVVATYDTTWNGAAYCDSATMTEGTHYIRYRMSKAALGLGEEDKISVIYLSHPKRHDSARLGLAGVQIVEVANDGYYTRNAACESTDWLADGGWLNSSSSEITWTNPTGTDVAYATIDADGVSAINIDGEVVASDVKLTNTAPEEGEDEKTFTFTASDGGTLTAPVDATGFYGKIVPCEGMTSAISLGDNAYIEVNVEKDQTVAIENILPSGVTVIGGTVKIVGEGTIVCDGSYPTAYATSFQNADTWKGTVWLKNVELSGAGMSNYGNTNSTIKATGVVGWIWSGDQGIANLELADEGDKIAYSIDDTSGGWTYSFAKLTGNGSFKYSTQAATSAGVAIGDVSEFTGAILSTYGVHHSTTNITTPRPIYIGTTNAVAGSKSLISVADGATINAGCGWEAGSVAFGATLTVKGAVNDVIVSNVTNAVPVLATKVTLDGVDGIYCLAYADGKVSVADAVAFTVADCDNATFTVAGAFKDGESYYAPANAAITVTYTATSGYTFPSTGTGTLVVNGTATAGAAFSAGETPVAPGVPFIFTIAEGEEGVWTLDGKTVTKAVVDADTSREIWKQGNGSMTNVVINRTYFVKEGTMVAGDAANKTGTVTVDADATFDFNGAKDGYITVNLNGGSLVNNGTDMGSGSRQIEGIALTANSTVGGTGTFGMSSNSHHANTLDLGGATLTKEDANTFFLCNTTVTNGNVVVNGGTLEVADVATFVEAGLTINAGTTLKVDSNKTLTIGAINADGATINNTGTITAFTLTGSATLTGNGNWGTNTLDNATIDVGNLRNLPLEGTGTVDVQLTAEEYSQYEAITVFTTETGTISFGTVKDAEGNTLTEDTDYTVAGGTITPVDKRVAIESISIPETLEVAVGATNQIALTITPENATIASVAWESYVGAPGEVEVDQDGNVVGVTAGTAMVYVYVTDAFGTMKNAQCTVTVTAPGPTYPSWLEGAGEANIAKYYTWASNHGVSDPSAAMEDAFLLNCDNTTEAVNAAKALFKITSITVDGDDVAIEYYAPEGGYNGTVKIMGATVLSTDPTDWHEKTAGDQFFQASLELIPANE